MVQWDDMKCYDLLFLGRFLFSFGFCLIFILVILLYDKACSFGGLAGTAGDGHLPKAVPQDSATLAYGSPQGENRPGAPSWTFVIAFN